MVEAVKKYFFDNRNRIADDQVDFVLAKVRTLKDVVQAVYGPFGGNSMSNWQDDGSWVASFNGSYGWELVMEEVFKEIEQYLEPGTEIDIYPDSGVTKLKVLAKPKKNGRHTKYNVIK